MRDKILLIEDDNAFAESIKALLLPESLNVDVASSGSEAIKKFRNQNAQYSVCILDYNLPDMTGTDVAQLIFRQNPNQEIIFMTADDSKETFRSMTSHGYTKRFLMKDEEPRLLVNKIKETVNHYNRVGRKFTGPMESATEIEKDLKSIGLIGRSSALHKIYKEILKLKNSKCSVLILGESGTGKELISTALNNTENKYFPINCATYGSGSENFLATQLFGHVKGAYSRSR